MKTKIDFREQNFEFSPLKSFSDSQSQKFQQKKLNVELGSP